MRQVTNWQFDSDAELRRDHDDRHVPEFLRQEMRSSLPSKKSHNESH